MLVRNPVGSILVLLMALFAASCSVPNLEEPGCADARVQVKQFYSFHLGNDMTPSPENLKLREKFLTADLVKTLSASTETKVDYFTATADYPKAFRIGTCKVISPEKTEFQVLLFWRDDKRSEQKELSATAVKENGKWLLEKVMP
jgi:hypothetical protein